MLLFPPLKVKCLFAKYANMVPKLNPKAFEKTVCWSNNNNSEYIVKSIRTVKEPTIINFINSFLIKYIIFIKTKEACVLFH